MYCQTSPTADLPLTPPNTPSKQTISDVPYDCDVCPACHGSGYITSSSDDEAPCLTCPGPQLSRYPTTYDGIGMKGQRQQRKEKSSSKQLKVRAPSPLIIVRVDEVDVSSSGLEFERDDEACVDANTVAYVLTNPRARWSLKLDWMRQRHAATNSPSSADTISPLSPSSSPAQCTSLPLESSFPTRCKDEKRQRRGYRRKLFSSFQVGMAKSAFKEMAPFVASYQQRLQQVAA
ncbi:uncharacterized protein EV422DRAFT_535862 [Fimicolochytrium jonesii]|uniref:uncharacterized protein n=1 Tax=Fimicolochytrium jonesii TaxID=1396493 RepID=UPI0022FE8A1F|nr:uncharacterized protein EV422DRAFT_535862 [Fimicolochytrium jonesii]KAI8818902.1 hypothetical protein EV422DRAFT_535862 [Fimicolochytrium jonesii]